MENETPTSINAINITTTVYITQSICILSCFHIYCICVTCNTVIVVYASLIGERTRTVILSETSKNRNTK